MDDWSIKVMYACDADYRSKLLDKRQRPGSIKANHELQVYHIMLRIPIWDVQEIYLMKEGE